ncbi:MAG: helix-turn-helix domain-containing protein [Oscillospiraceae bacterium]|nr:helix-turn-helix domain-containing protein [Oscillospiraceae bacterium]
MMLHAYYEVRRDGNENIYYEKSAARAYGAHFHKGVEVSCCLEDGLQILHNGRLYTLSNGDVLVARSFDVHQFLNEKMYSTLILPPSYLRHFDAYCAGRVLIEVLLTPQTGSLEILPLVEAFADLDGKTKLEKQGMVDQLLGALCRLCGVGDRQEHADEQTARKLLLYLSENYRSDVSLMSTAEELSFSKYHLSHVLRQTVGMNFSRYLNQLRLQHFEALMQQDPERDILTAALESGFQSAPTFYRVYREIRGMTPGMFVRDFLKTGRENA